jgi:hypothetical protein
MLTSFGELLRREPLPKTLSKACRTLYWDWVTPIMISFASWASHLTNELGGKRFFDLHCADEATGLEEVVEEWNDAVVGALQELLEIGGCNSPKE